MTSTFTLVLNSSQVVPNTNNCEFKYPFLNGNFTVRNDSEICVSSLILPYAWFNISASYGNNKFTFNFPRGASSPLYTVTIPDGFYLVSDLNNYLQQFCIQNSLYLINGANYVYYIVIATNVTTYTNQIILYPVPTSLPSGYTAPSGFIFPFSNYVPTITIPSGLGVFLGFSPATYGIVNTVAQTFSSNLTPIGSTVNGVIVRCSLVNNNVTMPSDILDSIPINASFGSNINYLPTFEKWVSIKSGTYNNFTVTLCDQNFNQIFIRDSNTTITLVLRNK